MEPSSQVWTEVARQVPALLVLAGLVIYFFRELAAQRESSEKRLEAMLIALALATDARDKRQDDTIKQLAEVIKTNNECLGAIRTLLSLFGEDLKNASKR